MSPEMQRLRDEIAALEEKLRQEQLKVTWAFGRISRLRATRLGPRTDARRLGGCTVPQGAGVTCRQDRIEITTDNATKGRLR